MKVNFVGNFQTGYVGEVADETHLAREIEGLGHDVVKIPRDEWREHAIDGKDYPNVPDDLTADINIICKWHHFYNGQFINILRNASEAPVFYWVWDYMDDQGIPEWHKKMVSSADLYLGNDVRNPAYNEFDNCYYFPFDVCDGNLARSPDLPEEYDVIFTGSYLKLGNRIEWLKKINQVHPVHIFAWNHEEWKKDGFENVEPAIYGEDYNELIKKSKIVLGFSVFPHCWGYWSNRVGKVIRAGGFLLQEFAPGMELLVGNKAEYFSSPEEAIEKIEFFLENDFQRNKVVWKAREDDRAFTSKRRVGQLMILAERYVNEKDKSWQI